MEALIGIRGADFVLLASDRNAARSIVVMKNCEEKTRALGRSLAMAYSGEAGSAAQFAEYLQANIKLYDMRHEYSLTCSGAAHYARRLCSDALRTRSPHMTSMLIGGFGGKFDLASSSSNDNNAAGEVPRLFWIDHYATLCELPFAAHGYAAYFVLSLMDRHYRPDMSVQEAMDLLKMCLRELKTRFIVNLPHFSVKVVRSDGIEDLVLSDF